jgi:hypothetical protein
VKSVSREDAKTRRSTNDYFFFEEDFFEDDFFEEDFVDAAFFEDAFFAGTLPPARRASDSPMAMACLRLVTFLPELPLFSVPRFRSCITFSTFSDAFFPYLLAIRNLRTGSCAGNVPHEIADRSSRIAGEKPSAAFPAIRDLRSAV